MGKTETYSIPGGAAAPREGEATRRLSDYLVFARELPTAESFQPIRIAALQILQRSKAFDAEDGRRTGLVVGCVQSGKTMSMAALTVLARDSGCWIVVVLAGTTLNLLKQSRDRFRQYLRSGGTRPGDWRILDSQESALGESDEVLLENLVEEWRDKAIPESEKTPLFVTVMKQHHHLDRAERLFSSVSLAGIPVLIIDDEADQAGLNTQPDKASASTTYRRIHALRGVFANHSYIQYTATPQAPLLISIADMLSPEFAEVIEPGAGYTGGISFFGAASRLVRGIGPADLFPPGSAPTDPPDSLIEAMLHFFVGAAARKAKDPAAVVSMLIHPSQRTDDQKRFLSFVQNVCARWRDELRAPEEDPDRLDLVGEMKRAYADLKATAAEIPTFDELLPGIQRALRRVLVTLVNSEDGSEVDWDNGDTQILVGGEKLNRGYTVKGLTVTYMPRNAGDWNADTIQQRARFFGYKGAYLGLCRVFLHPDVAQAYRDYVHHEQDIRRQLREHAGRPLRDWKRAFFLDAAMRPTRKNVLSDPFYRTDRMTWFWQRWPHLDSDIASRNQTLIDSFATPLRWEKYPKYPRHSSARVPLQKLFQDLLVEYGVVGSPDVVGLYASRCWIRDVLDRDPDHQALVIRILGSEPDHPPRLRSEQDDGDIKLAEGRRSSGDADAYQGDAGMYADDQITVQFHTVDVKRPGGTSCIVPAIAIRVPDALKQQDVLVQPNG